MRHHGRSRLALAGTLAAVVFGGGCRLESLNGNGDSAAIEPDLQAHVAALLDRQTAAWNAGDLDGFMSGYDRSPTTTYLGSSGLIEGYESIRQRYAPGFAPGAERDSLRVAELRVREVETRVAVATARYILERDGEVTATGQFTLVLLNAEGAWLIVHDQSGRRSRRRRRRRELIDR